MKIPIKKTNRKVPKSRWELFVWEIDSDMGVVKTVYTLPPLVVQDISIGLEDPLFTGAYEYAKPSLLTRVKERFKR